MLKPREAKPIGAHGLGSCARLSDHQATRSPPPGANRPDHCEPPGDKIPTTRCEPARQGDKIPTIPNNKQNSDMRPTPLVKTEDEPDFENLSLGILDV